MLIGVCTVLLSGLAHLHNCGTPRPVILPPLLQFHSLPITSPLTQAYYPEYLMSDCLAALWDWEDPLYINWGCSFCEDVGVDLQQQWEQCPETVPINRVETAWFCLLCSFWLMSSRFSLMPATLSFGQALWCEVSVWSQGTPSTNVAKGEEWSHWEVIL